ncbi:MAG: haloacid dehalogenase-like hydrolase [Isosphaeraceae bacterium]
MAEARKILVTDFDGTLTRRDVYLLISERLLPPDTPDFWAEYRAGRLTHFEALRGYFAAANGGEAALNTLLPDAELEPNLGAELDGLRGGGWDVVVVSAGCAWYIDRILGRAGVSIPTVANPAGSARMAASGWDCRSVAPIFRPRSAWIRAGLCRPARRSRPGGVRRRWPTRPRTGARAGKVCGSRAG